MIALLGNCLPARLSLMGKRSARKPEFTQFDFERLLQERLQAKALEREQGGMSADDAAIETGSESSLCKASDYSGTVRRRTSRSISLDAAVQTPHHPLHQANAKPFHDDPTNPNRNPNEAEIKVKRVHFDPQTLFILAAEEGDLPAMLELLPSNPDLILCSSAHLGFTALHFAAANGHVEMLQHLLSIERGGAEEWGVDCRARGKQLRWTPLHAAAYGGHEEAVRVLLEAGADPSIEDAQGDTPLCIARQQSHHPIAAILCQAQAKRHQQQQ